MKTLGINLTLSNIQKILKHKKTIKKLNDLIN